MVAKQSRLVGTVLVGLTHLKDVPELGEDLRSRLRRAVTDSYSRKSSKRARYRPPNPDKKPLGDPTIRRLTDQEKKKLVP